MTWTSKIPFEDRQALTIWALRLADCNDSNAKRVLLLLKENDELKQLAFQGMSNEATQPQV